MAKRRLPALLATAGLVAGVVSASCPAMAQERLPGVVAAGRYGEGTLGTMKQPAPDMGAVGATYGVGPWPTYTAPLADGPGRDLVIGACSVFMRRFDEQQAAALVESERVTNGFFIPNMVRRMLLAGAWHGHGGRIAPGALGVQAAVCGRRHIPPSRQGGGPRCSSRDEDLLPVRAD